LVPSIGGFECPLLAASAKYPLLEVIKGAMLVERSNPANVG
jgi:hypothetical protein